MQDLLMKILREEDGGVRAHYFRRGTYGPVLKGDSLEYYQQVFPGVIVIIKVSNENIEGKRVNSSPVEYINIFYKQLGSGFITNSFSFPRDFQLK